MSRNAFTLIELLVVIAIIAAVVSILLPALGVGQEAGKDAVCLANFREIAWTAGAHSHDNDSSGTKGCPTQPRFLDTSGYTGIEVVTKYVSGGHQHVGNTSIRGGSTDKFVIATESRPYTEYVAPGTAGLTGERHADIACTDGLEHWPARRAFAVRGNNAGPEPPSANRSPLLLCPDEPCGTQPKLAWPTMQELTDIASVLRPCFFPLLRGPARAAEPWCGPLDGRT